MHNVHHATQGWIVASRDHGETGAQRSCLLGAMFLNRGIKRGEDVLPNLVHC